ncbi:MAG: hypothetical protein ACLFXM_11055 [Acidimicrobiia bacterium]
MAAVRAQARPTLRLAVLFAVAAAVAAAASPSTGRWLPLHLFLAGGLGLAISAATQQFAVTWSAGPAPPRVAAQAQRWSVALGAAGVTAAREADLPWAVLAVAGGAFIAGLAGLAVLLVASVRRGAERRFDVALGWYLGALACGVAGGTIGIVIAGGSPGDLRGAHVVLNLLGLVGLVIGGTVPFFVATEARTRMSPRATDRRLTALLAWQLAAVAVAAGGLAWAQRWAAVTGLVAYVAGLVGLAAALPAVGGRQVRWAGPRLVQLLAGLAWWVGAVAAAAVAAARGRTPLAGDALIVLVVAGYAQVLWGSLAYLLPVLRAGGHHRLTAGFAETRSWVALVAANLAGVALVLGEGRLAAVLVGVWLLDALWRVVRVEATG